MQITSLLKDANKIIVPLTKNNPELILEELLNALDFPDKIKKQYLKSLKEREKQISTGIGNEVAIPHIRSKKENEFKMAIGISKEGIDFKDPTKCKTKIFFLTISPSEQGEKHLSLLSHIAIMTKDTDFIDKLKKAQSNNEAYDLIDKKEKSLKKLKTETEVTEGKITKYQMLGIILYREEYLSDILSVLYEFDLKKTTVIEGKELKTALTANIPIFQGFRDIMQEDNRVNKLIISLVEEDYTFRIAKMIENSCGGFDSNTDGFIFSIPVNLHLGI